MSEVINEQSLYLTGEATKKDLEQPKLTVVAKAKPPPNMAIYQDDQPHPVVAHVLRLAKEAFSAYVTQRTTYNDKWKKADEFYWMNMKDERCQEFTRAVVSSSTFYRVTRRLTDGAMVAMFADDMPMKFVANPDPFEDSKIQRHRAYVARGLNKVTEKYAQKIDLRKQVSQACYQTYKYANSIVYVPWEYEVEKRKRWEERNPNEAMVDEKGSPYFIHKETGEVSPTPHAVTMHEVEEDVVTKDWPGYYPCRIDSIWLDNTIEDLDRQTFLFWRTDLTRDEMFKAARTGTYANIEKISSLQRFNFYDLQNVYQTEVVADDGRTFTDAQQSETYGRTQIWMLLPEIKYTQNKKGEVTDLEWDQSAPSCRYLMEFVGEIENPIIVRFSKSPYWTNRVPFIKASSHEDDTVGFYHRGNMELLEDNMFQEQVAKGQLMDNRTLQNFRPIKRLVGRVRNKSLKITHNTVFDVTSQDAIQQLEISDITGTISNTLEYIKKDSEDLGMTPAFMLGQAQGARTTATEFSAIRDQSSAPALNDIAKIQDQLIGGWLKKVKEYVPQFLDRDVLLEDEKDANGRPMRIAPDAFNHDLDIEDVSIATFESKTVTRQIFVQLIQAVLANPVFASAINPVGTLVKLFSMFPEVVDHPEELLLLGNPAIAQALQVYKGQFQQQQKALETGQPPQQAPGQSAPGGTPAGPPPPPMMTGQSQGQALAAPLGASGGG